MFGQGILNCRANVTHAFTINTHSTTLYLHVTGTPRSFACITKPVSLRHGGSTQQRLLVRLRDRLLEVWGTLWREPLEDPRSVT